MNDFNSRTLGDDFSSNFFEGSMSVYLMDGDGNSLGLI